MPRTLVYPKHPENKVKRYNHRDRSTVHLLARSPFLENESLLTHTTFRIATYGPHASHTIISTSFNSPPENRADDCFPAILPMIGVMGSFASPSSNLHEALDCYLHGCVSSRLILGHEGGQSRLPVSRPKSTA